MKTKIYSLPGLEGSYVELGYGKYTQSQYNISIGSINLPPYATIILYSNPAFNGTKRILENNGKKWLKIVNIPAIYSKPVLSVEIICSCSLITQNNSSTLQIFIDTFIRSNQQIGYTFFKLIPHHNSTTHKIAFIIPDFGTNKSLYYKIQQTLASMHISSLILDFRGVETSLPSTNMQYAEIIQDYRYIGQNLGLIKRNSKPIVIGHGIGGAIAQLWALTYTMELSKLILIDTAPYATYNSYSLINSSTVSWTSGVLPFADYAQIVSNYTFNTMGKACDREVLDEDYYDSIISSNQQSLKLLITQNPDDPSLSTAPQYITVKTLIIHGKYDAYISINGGKTLHTLIKNSFYRELTTGHAPHFSVPMIFFDAIRIFLAS
jgi:pimeloyl-ACP methyl ester carboxylesterase